MAVKYWEGKALAVAQVGDFKITADDAATTYKVTIGDQVISQVGTGGTIAATITALLTKLTGSVHPYFSNITWTSPAADTIRGTANTAGVPFIATFTKTGGAGTVNAYAVVAASAGPNHWGTANNWSDNLVPVNGDTVILKDNSVDILWDLDQSAVNLAKFQEFQSYTGKIGLDYSQFATSPNSAADEYEYRTVYLAFAYCSIGEIGEIVGPGTPTGSPRTLIDWGSDAKVTVFNSASVSADANRPALRFKSNYATNDFYIRSAPGGVGFASEIPGETSVLRKISVSDPGSSTTIQIGSGVTIATFEQTGGNNVVRSAADMDLVRAIGGTLTTEGDMTVALLIADGALIYANHIKTGASAITKGFTKNGGVIDGTRSNKARTWDYIYAQPPNGTVIFDGLFTTITYLGTGNFSEGAPYYIGGTQYLGRTKVTVTN